MLTQLFQASPCRLSRLRTSFSFSQSASNFQLLPEQRRGFAAKIDSWLRGPSRSSRALAMYDATYEISKDRFLMCAIINGAEKELLNGCHRCSRQFFSLLKRIFLAPSDHFQENATTYIQNLKPCIIEALSAVCTGLLSPVVEFLLVACHLSLEVRNLVANDFAKALADCVINHEDSHCKSGCSRLRECENTIVAISHLLIICIDITPTCVTEPLLEAIASLHHEVCIRVCTRMREDGIDMSELDPYLFTDEQAPDAYWLVRLLFKASNAFSPDDYPTGDIKTDFNFETMTAMRDIARKNGLSACAFCHQVSSSTVTLSACANCKLVRYCSKECQKGHWKKCHRYVCKHMRSKSMVALCKWANNASSNKKQSKKKKRKKRKQNRI